MRSEGFQNFSKYQFNNRIFERNADKGWAACEIFASALNAVDPYRCMVEHVRIEENTLYFGNEFLVLDAYKRVFLIGFGKASVPMAKGLLDVFENKIDMAKVIAKDPSFLSDDGYQGILNVLLGGHPLPTEGSITSTQNLLGSLSKLSPDDLVLAVISGGGSALFTDPISGITLDAMQQTTRALLRCGANIDEINTLRKHLDRVKGGGLLRWLQPASLCTFILSDVIGDPLDMIASGPTVPDPTTFYDAMAVLVKYDLSDQVPTAILKGLEDGIAGVIPETLKPGDLPEEKIKNYLVGTNIQAAEAAKEKANSLGYQSIIITSYMTGLTDHAAVFINGIIQTLATLNHPIPKPACLIFGGETTVEVVGDGLGGRNQDLALKMVQKISGLPNVLFATLATDGEDGPTEAAGAACDGLLLEEGKEIFGLDLNTYIQNNDSYHYFEKLGGLIKIGSTGTNVNDLTIILID